MMLECWRHNAARRPSFIQLLDQLVPDLSDEFRNVSYYFNHEPDIDDAAGDADSVNCRNVPAEDVGETVPFRTSTATQPARLEPSSSAVDSEVSDVRNLSDQDELQTSGFVGRSSMSSLPNATTAPNTAQSSSQPDRHVGNEELRNSQRSSRETGASSCRNDVQDAGSKDSSGSSQGSHKNGLINGCVIPFGSAVPSSVH